MKDSWKLKYAPYYRIAEKVLGDSIRHLRRTDVREWVSPEDWLIIPIRTEKNREEATNRPYPNLYFELNDKNHALILGLVSNTLSSTDRMRNLLLGYHQKDRKLFVENMQALDRRFKTVVNEKRYSTPFSVPEYVPVLRRQTNSVSDADLKSIFIKIGHIRDKGIRDKQARQKLDPRSNWVRFLPHLDIARINLRQNKRDFANALAQLKPLADICMRIKTRSQIEGEMRKLQKQKVTILTCQRCHSSYEPPFADKFCPKCHTFLLPTQVTKDKLEQPTLS